MKDSRTKNTITLSISVLSLVALLISLYFLFIPVESGYVGEYYNDYISSATYLIIANALAIIANNRISKVIIAFNGLILLVVGTLLVYLLFTGSYGKSDGFFNTVLLGFCAWIMAILLVIRFSGTIKKKIILLGTLLGSAIILYAILRFSKAVWQIFRHELGAHLVWMILGVIVMLICAIFYYKRANFTENTTKQ